LLGIQSFQELGNCVLGLAMEQGQMLPRLMSSIHDDKVYFLLRIFEQQMENNKGLRVYQSRASS
jgi:hypothetical protein